MTAALNRTVTLKVSSPSAGSTMIGTLTVDPGAPLAPSGMRIATSRATTSTAPLIAADGKVPSFRSCCVRTSGEEDPTGPTAWKTTQATCPVPLSADALNSVKRTVPGSPTFDTRVMPLA